MQNMKIQQATQEGFVPFSGGGSGLIDNPYILKSPKDLDYIRFERDAVYMLEEDIDCSETEFWGEKQGSVGYVPIVFEGILLGNGHSIKNLYMQGGGFPFIVLESAIISDLEIETKTKSKHKIGAGVIPNFLKN